MVKMNETNFTLTSDTYKCKQIFHESLHFNILLSSERVNKLSLQCMDLNFFI